MKLDIQFVGSELNEETKLTTVTLRYMDKYFYGYSKPIGEDIDHFSQFRGGRIAELKAAKKAFKYIIEEKQAQFNKSHKKTLLRDIEDLEKVLKTSIGN